MAQFIEVNADGIGEVSINIDLIASITNTDGGSMIYLNAKHSNGSTIQYFVK